MGIGFIVTIITLAALIGFFSRQALQTADAQIGSEHPEENSNLSSNSDSNSDSSSEHHYESHSHII